MTKYASDLHVGDRAQIKHGRRVTVVAVEPGVQTIQRRIVRVTWRHENGTESTNTYGQNAAITVIK